MNKKELVGEIKKQMAVTGITTRQIDEVMTHACDIIAEVANNELVKLKGFGSFRVKTRASKIGRNPKTGEQITIFPRQVLTFKAAR